MKITLLSIPPNSVIDTLLKHDKVDLVHINPIDNIANLSDYIGNLDTEGMLITYRCPKIIPKEIYSRFNQGAYNIHPSLLPKYSGLNPWKEIFEDGVKVSGVTVHKISDIVDGGEIIKQKRFSIDSEDSLETARNKADELAAKMVIEFINDFFNHTRTP